MPFRPRPFDRPRPRGLRAIPVRSRRSGLGAFLGLGLVLLAAAGRPPQGGECGPAAAGEGGEPGTRLAAGELEHFVLELPGADGTRVVGALRALRRRAADGLHLEWEVDFPREGVRVLAHEHLFEAGSRLVWRELAGSAGRSLIVEWSADGGELLVLEWARDGTVRESRDARAGAVLPLYLLELARESRAAQGSFPVLDPLARALVPWTLTTRYALERTGVPLSGSGEALREVELRRPDGTLVGRYRFRGSELLAFEWQEGGVRGRRVESAEHEAALEALARPTAPPRVTSTPAVGSIRPLDPVGSGGGAAGSVREP